MESRCSLQERFLFYFALYCDQMTNLLRSTEEIVRKKVVALSSKACNAKKSLLKLKQELKGLSSTNLELNFELSQVLRANRSLRREVSVLGGDVARLKRLHCCRLNQKVSELPTVPEDSRSNSFGPSSSSSGSLSMRSSSFDEEEKQDKEEPEESRRSSRLAELRSHLTEVKRKNRLLTNEIVEKDTILANAQQQICDLQRELDVNKEECYGHLKVLQSLKKLA